MPPSFSIVINTLNRAPLLAKTLDSLRWLRYRGRFEVIVVNGPSTDHSQDIIDAWLPAVRSARCAVANLSVSRNIGICMARGDIVAFIDDDAIPEPEWLEQLARAYDNPAVGAAGGLVFDQTGYTYQYEYSTATRLANANWRLTRNADHLAYPGAFEFPYLQGTNASFRRSALLEVGGFDEEIEYYLDETELCCRLVDAGYLIRQLPNAYVHHKFAPSNIRNEHKITRYRYPVIKNKLYFSLKHGRDYLPLPDILDDNRRFVDQQAQEVEAHIAGGRLPASEREALAGQVRSAWERGMERGLSGVYEYITPDKRTAFGGSFVPFSRVLSHPAVKNLVFVDRRSGAGAVSALASSLAAHGHCICVVTQSEDIDRVDFEQGVWVHRIVAPKPASAANPRNSLDQPVSNWSTRAFDEVRRIAGHRRIDAVEIPLEDGESLPLFLAESWPVIVQVDAHTTFPLPAPLKQQLIDATAVRCTVPSAQEHVLALRHGLDEDGILLWPDQHRPPASGIE